MAKVNQKCVRMTDEVLKIVEKAKGEGFNQKFENLVIEFHKTIPEREKYKENLEQQIQTKLKQLSDIVKRINGIENIEFNLGNLRRDILRIEGMAKDLPIVSQNESCIEEPTGENEIQTRKRKKCIS